MAGLIGVVTMTDFSRNMGSWLQKVRIDGERFIVRARGHRDIMVMPLQDYENLMRKANLTATLKEEKGMREVYPDTPAPLGYTGPRQREQAPTFSGPVEANRARIEAAKVRMHRDESRQ